MALLPPTEAGWPRPPLVGTGFHNGWGATCYIPPANGRSDPSFEPWACQKPGLKCVQPHKSASEPGMGVCMTAGLLHRVTGFEDRDGIWPHPGGRWQRHCRALLFGFTVCNLRPLSQDPWRLVATATPDAPKRTAMSLQKTALFNVFTRTDGPRRETLRRERAKVRAQSKAPIDKPKLILASASPRRLTLLAQVGVEPDALRPASIDETPRRGEMPRGLVTRLARAKAETARDQIANDTDIADAFVLAADTVVAVGRRIMGKPEQIEEAVASLQLLSGRAHRVLTGLCLITPDDRVRIKIVDTRVRFKHLSRSEIEAYVASREWRGKAGGYAIQGLAGCFVQKITGSYTNVVGLPLTEVVAMLNGESFPIQLNWLKAAEADPE